MAGGELYIYYRLLPGADEAMLPALREIQAALAEACGCKAGLRRKPADGTLMEVYAGVEDPQQLQSLLDARLADVGFERHLSPGSRRHVEWFECV